MRCKTVQEKLDVYLAEGLTATDRRQIEAHLESCAACRAELAGLKQLLTLLKDHSAVPPVPDGFSTRLVDRARQRLPAQHPPAGKGDSPHLCEAPSGPFRQMGTVPFSRPSLRRWWASISLPMRAEAAAMLAAGLLIGVFLGQQTWHSARLSTPRQAAQAEPLTAYVVDYLGDVPSDSLAGVYLALTDSSQR